MYIRRSRDSMPSSDSPYNLYLFDNERVYPHIVNPTSIDYVEKIAQHRKPLYACISFYKVSYMRCLFDSNHPRFLSQNFRWFEFVYFSCCSYAMELPHNPGSDTTTRVQVAWHNCNGENCKNSKNVDKLHNLITWGARALRTLKSHPITQIPYY